MAAFSARLAKVRIGSNIIIANKWTVNVKVDEIDITTFENNGFADWLGGFVEADVSVDAFWDDSLDPTGPPGIQAGAFLANVKLYLNDLTSPFWSFPLFFVSSLTADAEVRGALKFSFTGKSKGQFFYP